MSSPLILDIEIQCESWRQSVVALDGVCARAADAVIAATGGVAPGTEVSLMLCDDDFIQDLNHRYRDKDAATNVLAFPLDEVSTPVARDGPPVLLGDIIIAHGTVVREASAAGRAIDHHLCHMVVHGMLHLLGFDHDADTAAVEMETMETRILATLGVPDPYARNDLAESHHENDDVQ